MSFACVSTFQTYQLMRRFPVVQSLIISSVSVMRRAELDPGRPGKFAVLLDARWTGVALSSAERASPGLGWRGDHPRPADPVAEVSDLPTIGDLVESCR
jgi:hypothetical protein